MGNTQCCKISKSDDDSENTDHPPERNWIWDEEAGRALIAIVLILALVWILIALTSTM